MFIKTSNSSLKLYRKWKEDYTKGKRASFCIEILRVENDLLIIEHKGSQKKLNMQDIYDLLVNEKLDLNKKDIKEECDTDNGCDANLSVFEKLDYSEERLTGRASNNGRDTNES